MEILPKRIYEILKGKGVTSILHANSVENSSLFLRNRCLMSREAIEKLNTLNTSTKAKHSGINYSIWNDIFTDSVDRHKQSNNIHDHGPALLKIDIEIIKNTYTGKVWVTKSNPVNWDANTHHERKWFVSANDLEDNFSYGSFDHMIVFRHCAGKLPIQGYLNKVVLDDPKLKTDKYQIDYFSMAFGALKLAMKEGGLEVPIEKRACNQGCGCLDIYKNGKTEPDKMFTL
ncbi:MAG: hypothetical protein ABW092_14745 [Candidatus Thiodiazotropha sp.]